MLCILLLYPRFSEEGEYTGVALSILLSVFLSVLPSVTNIFYHTFLSNHASQPLNTWYGASAMRHTRRLPKFRSTSCLPPVFRLSLISDITW